MTTRLFVGDFYVHVIGDLIPEELKRDLSYWHRSLVKSPGKNPVSGKKVSLYVIRRSVTSDGTEKDVLTAPSGFTHKIVRILSDLGTPVEIVDERLKRPGFDHEQALDGLRDYQRECALTALLSGGGIVACPTGWGKTRIIASIIRGYLQDQLKLRNTPTTVVVTPGADLCEKNFADLCKLLPKREVGMYTGRKKKLSSDVLVTTPDSLETLSSSGDLDMSEIGILIYDEVHTMTDNISGTLSKADRSMRFGFSATPTGRFDGADLHIEGIFGPVIYHRTFQEAVTDGAVVPIVVLWLNMPRPTRWKPDGYKIKDAAYNHGLWTCKELNSTIADIMTSAPDSVQALCVCDKLKHMNDILNYAPDLVQVHAESSSSGDSKDDRENIVPINSTRRRQIYEGVSSGELKKVISSGIYRTGVDFPELSVVVNAAGMGSRIIAGQLPGRTSRNFDGKNAGVIIDFMRPWDMVENKYGRMVPGAILKDDLSRRDTYASEALNFSQYFFDSVEELKGALGWV